jgi:hypothetical protein
MVSVAVPRNQNLRLVLVALEERRQEMLAVPYGDDGGKVEAVVEIRRLKHDARRVPDQPKIFRRDDADRFLHPRRSRDPFRQYLHAFRSALSLTISREDGRDRAADAGER